MIESIFLHNIKSVETLKIYPKRITLLIGPNSSGKSTLLQTLIVLKQSINQGTLMANGPYILLGSLDNFIRKEAENKRMRISIEGKIILDRNLLKQIIDDSNVINFLEIMRYTYELEANNASLTYVKSIITPNVNTQDNYTLIGEWNDLEASKGFQVKIKDDTYNGNVNPRVGNIFSFSPRGNLTQQKNYLMLQTLSIIIENQLQNIFFVPAYRGLISPSYPLGRDSKIDFTSIDPNVQGQNVTSTMAYRRDLEEPISNWIKQVTDTEIRVSLKPNMQVVIESLRKDLEIPIIMEGFGTNQLVQLFLTMAACPSGSTVLIEEPEIHLHPKAQSKLAELLVDISIKNDKQLIVTTHSEHILFKLLSLVKKGILNKSELAVYHFELENGTTKYELLEVDNNGMVKGGLKSFFDVSVGHFGDLYQDL